jgi:hypothetical protein
MSTYCGRYFGSSMKKKRISCSTDFWNMHKITWFAYCFTYRPITDSADAIRSYVYTIRRSMFIRQSRISGQLTKGLDPISFSTTMSFCGFRGSSYTHPEYSRRISIAHSAIVCATVKNINLGIQKGNPIFRGTREITRHFKAVYTSDVLQTAKSCWA